MCHSTPFTTFTKTTQFMQPLIVGEVLYDIFPDGRQVLGGAPFNVAWHLQGFGATPIFITAIADDTLGRGILAAMHHWKMDTNGVRVVQGFPTGRVQVKPGPSYQILADQAYDLIDPQLVTANRQKNAILYHGSLALRNPETRQRILSWRNQLDCPVFVDINVRPPWFDRSWLAPLLQNITYLKLNHEELGLIIGQAISTVDDAAEKGNTLLNQFGIDQLVVTCGALGAAIINQKESRTLTPAPTAYPFIDSVGAGDGFASVCLLGYISGWSLDTVLERESLFSARICSQRGATTADDRLYEEVLDAWGNSSTQPC